MTATFGRAVLAGVLLATLGAAVASGVLVDVVVRLRARRQEPRRACRGCPGGATA